MTIREGRNSMDRAQAIEWLQRLMGGAPPEITSEDITRALDQSRVVDGEGRAPVDAGYVETLNVHYAASLLFDLKADLAVATDAGGIQSFTSEGSSFTRRPGSGADQFRAVARRYRELAFPSGGGLTVIELNPERRTLPRSAVSLDTSHAHHQ